MLDVMHACAANSSGKNADAAPRSGPVAGGNEVGVQEPASASLWRGNTEWGPGGGEGGLVQAYNHVMRVCGKAGGAELTLAIVDEMHHRWALIVLTRGDYLFHNNGSTYSTYNRQFPRGRVTLDFEGGGGRGGGGR